MKRILLAGATLLALTAAQPTLAADAPVYRKGPAPAAAALFNWSGFYVGVSGGYGWGASRMTAPGGFDTGEFTGNGGLIGGTVGFNWQAPGSPLVLGLEGDLSWANIHPIGPTVPAFDCINSCHAVLNWLGTARGRFGVANGAILFYATGGFAFGGVNTFFDPFASAGSNVRTTTTGWTGGGGIEAMFGGGWTIKGEYLYVDLGSLGVTCPLPACGTVTTNYFRAHILRAGLNKIF